jgi:hypothetical protein
MWETLRTPKPLGKEQSHCSFCATSLREIEKVQEDSCWAPPIHSLRGTRKTRSQNMMFCTWARGHIATWQPIPVQRSRETWGLPHTPSCFSALLKYNLQKKNYALLPGTTPRPCRYSLLEHPRPELEPPLQLDCGTAPWGRTIHGPFWVENQGKKIVLSRKGLVTSKLWIWTQFKVTPKSMFLPCCLLCSESTVNPIHLDSDILVANSAFVYL